MVRISIRIRSTKRNADPQMLPADRVKTFYPFLARYYRLHFAGSSFRFLWAFINPLAFSLAILFVFTRVFRLQTPGLPLTVLSGFLAWQLFQGTLSRGHRIFLSERGFFKQLARNKNDATWAFLLFQFFLSAPGLIGLAAWCWIRHPFSVFAPAAFLFSMACLFLFLSGCVFGLGTWTVFCPDLSHVLDTLLLFLLWLSPVFYSAGSIPENFRFIVWVNPLAWFLDLFRASLRLDNALPAWFTTTGFGLVSLVTAYAGISFHRKHRGEMIARL
jgi:ABC-type polysaccharide/polyol phosphate export permease